MSLRRILLYSALAIVLLARCDAWKFKSSKNTTNSDMTTEAEEVETTTKSQERLDAITNCNTRGVPGVNPDIDACHKEHLPFVIDNRDWCMKKIHGSVPKDAEEWRTWGCDPDNKFEYYQVSGCTSAWYASSVITGKFSTAKLKAVLACWRKARKAESKTLAEELMGEDSDAGPQASADQSGAAGAESPKAERGEGEAGDEEPAGPPVEGSSAEESESPSNEGPEGSISDGSNESEAPEGESSQAEVTVADEEVTEAETEQETTTAEVTTVVETTTKETKRKKPPSKSKPKK